MTRSQIAIVSREVHPFGGGIGTYVSALARFLAADMDVTVFASTLRRDEMASPEAQSLLDGRVELVFVDEPPEGGSYFGGLHRYSANVLRALRAHYGTRGPDLIEFQDYLGEAAVTVQARVTREPFLADTPVFIRLNTTVELCALLDAFLDPSIASEQILALERYSLKFADGLLYGGGDIYGLYERVYGRDGLAPGHPVRQPLGEAGPIRLDAGHPLTDPPADGPLRLLYMGRLERRKGVQDLVRAMAELCENATLTLVGGDTDTAPLGTPMSWLLKEAVRGDARIEFIDHLKRADLPALIDRHHALAVPSIWECWPAVALEALARNRPLLATPVGGLLEMVQAGRSGWLTQAAGHRLADAIEGLARDRTALNGLIAGRAPRRVHEELCEGDEVRGFYAQAVPAVRRTRRRPGGGRFDRPLVSAIVPYYRASKYVEEAIDSLLDQTYAPIEIVLVNDGSFQLEDRIVGRLNARFGIRVATQPNSGLGAARNFGIKLSRGRYVALLDSDNMFAPKFVERAVEAMESDPRIAYVGTWSRYVDEFGTPFGGPGAGFQPLSNFLDTMRRGNVAGDAATLVRRSVYDRGYWYSDELTSYEDWDFFYRVRSAGLYGHCIPQRLLRYRVRASSMLREVGLPEAARLEGELIAHRRAHEISWTSPNA